MKTVTFEVWNPEDAKVVNKITVIIENAEEHGISLFSNTMVSFLEEYFDTEVTKGEPQ